MFRKETTRSHFTEIQLLRAYQISRTKTSQTIESLVQASGFPLHRHGYTVVIKLKGPAISLPQISHRKRIHIERTERQHVRVLFAARIRFEWIHESNVKQGIRFVERRKLIPLFKPLAPVLFRCSNIHAARPFFSIPSIRKSSFRAIFPTLFPSRFSLLYRARIDSNFSNPIDESSRRSCRQCHIDSKIFNPSSVISLVFYREFVAKETGR